MASMRCEFLSLFVPDLDTASQTYASIFGVEPGTASGGIPERHPFSPRPPVVFDLGGVKLALYQIDGRITHAGDVGIGVVTDEDPSATLQRAAAAGGQPLLAPKAGDTCEMGVFVLPDRHFFEVVRPSR
ncbi:hypothetical protein ACFL6C_13340 [Myxococcota bacterium]